MNLASFAKSLLRKSNGYEREGYVILNYIGGRWNEGFYLHESDAQKAIDQYGFERQMFKIVPATQVTRWRILTEHTEGEG